MAAQELVRCHCAVSVEVGGKALKADKTAKQFGVQVVKVPTGTTLRVLGFRRDIVLAYRNLRTVVDSKIQEGRLGFVGRDGMQVVLSKAQPTQLHAILKALRGEGQSLGLGLSSSASGPCRPVATPALSRGAPRVRPAVEQSQEVPSEQTVARLSLCDLREEVLGEFMAFLPPKLRPLLGEACKLLAEMTVATGSTFRFSRDYSGSVPPQLVARRVQRQTRLTVLDLTGFEALTAGASKDLAEGLEAAGRSCLKSLRLRGCKGLSDASVRRLLGSCPGLEILDLLEIPRLSNKAVQVPLPALRFFAAGSLGRAAVYAKQTKHSESVGLMASRIDVAGGAKAAIQSQAAQRPQHASLFTSAIFAQLMTPELPNDAARATASSSSHAQKRKGSNAGNEPSASSSSRTQVGVTTHTESQAALAAPPLTHVVLAHCADIEVLPKLPLAIQHLDLRGTSLQVPEAAIAGWRPLSSSTQLQVLNLAGNTLLSSRALLACVASLPSRTQLQVLDISDTRAEGQLFTALPAQAPELTHLRVANCMALSNARLAELLLGLRSLEVLDIAGCSTVEGPLSDLVPPALPSAAAPAASTGLQGNSSRQVLAPRLRLFGLGRTALSQPTRLEFTRRALAIIAPLAEAVPGSLDIFKSYSAVPVSLL